MSNSKVQHQFYVRFCGEARDVDIRLFRLKVMEIFKSRPELRVKCSSHFEVSESRFHDLIVRTAGTPDGKGNPNFTLGPRGIMRFTCSILERREKYAKEFTKDFLARHEKTIADWNAKWEAKQKEKSSETGKDSSST
ncbi:hypothetical protein DL98DRAFT_219862 [Cadophora sp. DSE1049]|nr:hypothetical protein DL98DRAFT_219862 [Cadophora sp. DSE1049]